MHSSHAARRQKILRLLQNAWVTRNIAVTQSVYWKRRNWALNEMGSPKVDEYDGAGTCILTGGPVDRRVVIAKAY